MIKNYKFTVNQDEKRRILDLHESRTSSQYLNLLEQETIEFDEQVETNEQGLSFNFSSVHDPANLTPPNQIKNVQTRDESGDDKYDQKPTIQPLPPEDVAKLVDLKQKEVTQTKSPETKTTGITFQANDPTGKNTVLAKMKELKLDTTNLKDSIKSVITKLGYTL